MKIYKYDLAGWSEIYVAEWDEKDTEESWYKKLGFKERVRFYIGDENDPKIEVRDSIDADDKYLLNISLEGIYCKFVICDNFPSLMNFIKDYGTFFKLEEITFKMFTLEMVSEKLFHAWHGHDFIESCYECDPATMRKIKMNRERKNGK